MPHLASLWKCQSQIQQKCQSQIQQTKPTIHTGYLLGMLAGPEFPDPEIRSKCIGTLGSGLRSVAAVLDKWWDLPNAEQWPISSLAPTPHSHDRARWGAIASGAFSAQVGTGGIPSKPPLMQPPPCSACFVRSRHWARCNAIRGSCVCMGGARRWLCGRRQEEFPLWLLPHY